TYHYGFASTIGAGPYDRSLPDRSPAPAPAPESVVTGGGNALAAPLAALGPAGTVTVGDCLTYDSVADLGNVGAVTVRAKNGQRPVIRLPAGSPWTFHGAAEDSRLSLEGLFVSGADLILTGSFDSVTFTCCTLDP